MGEPHARRKFCRILSAVGEDDQLPIRVLCRLRYLSQQSVGKHLCDFLKTSAHDANGRVESAASPILVAARANCGISLTCSVIVGRIRPVHRWHMVEIAIPAAECDRAVGGQQISGTPVSSRRDLIPLRCQGCAIGRPKDGVVPILSVKERHLRRCFQIRMVCAEKISAGI